jgi:hypothetical protein
VIKHVYLREAVNFACGLALLVGLCSFDGGPVFAQPAITSFSPAVVKPGATTEIKFSGTKLDGPVNIWTTFPARCEWIGHDPKAKDVKQLVCKLHIPAGTSIGLGGVVVSTINGVSDVLPVMIDELPLVVDGGNNRQPGTPQEVTLPAAIAGTGDGATADYYSITAKLNEKIAIDLVAARLGADFDGVLRVLDASGKELLMLDDDAAAGADCRGLFVAPADGKYVVELRDNRFKNGGKYLLRMGVIPLVTTAHPLGVQRGVPTAIGFVGPHVEGAAPLTLLIGESSARRTSLSAGAGWSTLAVDDLPTAVESAGSKDPRSLPIALHGILAAPKEKDEFPLTIAKGQRVTFRPISRSVGSPASISLRLINAAGGTVGEAAVTENEEEPLSVVVPDDGVYKLQVSDLIGRGGSDFSYRIEARTGPTFSLALKNDPKVNKRSFSIPRDGGAFTLDVTAARNGYDGPIRLNVESTRSGWQVMNNVIPTKAAEVKLYVIPPADWDLAEIAPLRVVGQATEQPEIATATMSTVTQLRLAKPAMIYPPAWLDGLILVSGKVDKADFYTLAQTKPEVTFLRQIGQSQLTLAMQRTNAAFKDVPLTVVVPKTPAGLSAEVKRNGNGPAETYDIILKGAKDIPAGRHTLRYFTYAELTGNGQCVLSNDVVVNIVDPLAVTVAPAGPIVAGQKQKVKLAVIRRGDDRQAVELKFKALPPGVTGPEKIALTADQNDMEIELTAAADAAPVMFKELVVIATSTTAGQNVTGESAAATLEVKKP